MLVINNNIKVDNGDIDIDIDIDGGNAVIIEGLGHRRRRRCSKKVIVAVAVLVMTSIVLLLVVATTTTTTTASSWYYQKLSSISMSISLSTSISRLLSSSFSYLSSFIIITTTTTSTATRISSPSPLQNMNMNINSSSSILLTTEIKEKKQKQKQKQTYEPHCSNNNQHQHQHQQYDYYEYEAPEPYEYLNNCCDDCNFNPYIYDISPDPLISMTWNTSNININSNSNSNSNDDDSNNKDEDENENENYFTPLQIYRTSIPIKQWYVCEDEDDHDHDGNDNNNTDCVSTDPESRKIQIRSNATIGWDWGSERSSWFELISINTTNLVDDPSVIITGSISEFNTPYPGKTVPLIKYGNHTYRLETNQELYEGVRYTFLHIKFAVLPLSTKVKTRTISSISTATTTTATTTDGPSKNDVVNNAAVVVVEINDYSIVSKIKPIEYTGQFYSSNKLLTRAYYWGAYGVRLNVERDQLNSVLIERGDRVAIQGDGHPTIATVLEVFYSKEIMKLLKNVLNSTDNAHQHVVDDYIMAYPLYWCLSSINYLWHVDSSSSSSSSSDRLFMDQKLIQDISFLLDKRINDFLDSNLDITWFGWDDRIGNGWCFHSKNDVCTREGLLSFAGLVIRVTNDFVNILLTISEEDDEDESQENHHEKIKNMVMKYQLASKKMTKELRNVPEYPSQFGVHSAANAINAGISTEEEIQQYWMQGNKKGINDTLNDSTTICSFSQFNQYWILQAYGNMMDGIGMEYALKSIDLCWSPMMKLSTGGCFWEISSPEWLRFMNEGDQAPHLPSYCHPWSSGVTPWLSTQLGGINPLKRGYKQFLIMPYLSMNYPSVMTQVNTPHGYISVNATLSPSSLSSSSTSFIMTMDSSSSSSSSSDVGPSDYEDDDAYVEKKTLPLLSPSFDSYEFKATVEAPVSGLYGIRRKIILKPLSSATTSHEEAWLDINTMMVNGIYAVVTTINTGNTTTAADTIIVDPENADQLRHQKTKEYIFLRLDPRRGGQREDSSSTTSSHVISALYSRRRDNDNVNINAKIKNGNDALSSFDSTKHNRHLGLDNISPFPLPTYRGTVLHSVDRVSQGDGLFLYGKDGYMLLGFDNDHVKLPSYISQIRIRRHGYPGWEETESEFLGYSDTDPIYLPLEGGTAKRGLGRVGIDDAGGGDINCILVDVEVEPPTTASTTANTNRSIASSTVESKQYYSLSIYFVAGRKENRHAIRVMDGNTFEVIAPTTLVKDYTGGVWWTLRYDQSVRLKIMDIEGIYLSAIAFTRDIVMT